MNYKKLQIINTNIRNKGYLNNRYVKHVKINFIEDNIIYGLLYNQYQKNKVKIEESADFKCTLEELIDSIERHEFYVNNISVLKIVV